MNFAILSNIKKLPEQNIFLFLCAFSFGIIITDLCPLWFCGILFLCSAICAFASKKAKIIFLALVFILGGLDYFSYRLLPKDHISYYDTDKIEWAEGYVASDTEKHKNSYLFYLNCSKIKTENKIIKVSGKTAVYLKCEAHVAKGDRIRLSSFFYTPKPQTNPIKFDYSEYMARKNVYTATSLKNINDLTVIRKAKHISAIKTAKTYIEKIYRKYLDSQCANLLMGMILGNGNYLDDTTYNNFINTSTLHLLAASGINCCVLIFVLHWILCFMEFRKKNIIIIPIIWFYAAMIGFPGSILRASLMCSLVLLGQSIKAFTEFRHTLFLSAFLILIFCPNQLFDIGFQLSYLCLIGILYVYPVLDKICHLIIIKDNKYSPRRESFIKYFIQPITVYLGVNIVIAPICVYYFNYISFVGLFANIAVGTLAGFIFVMAVLFLFVCHIPFISHIFINITNLTGKGILWTVNTFGKWNMATCLAATPSKITVCCEYIVIFLIIFLINAYINKKYADKKYYFIKNI